MTDDVDDVAIGRPYEESPHAPRFIGERMYELIPTPARVGVCLVHVGADVDRDDGILRCAGIAGYELYRDPPVRCGVPGHPAEVHRLHAQAQVLPVELARSRYVGNREVRGYAGYPHDPLLF